jgi:hypothetical protein
MGRNRETWKNQTDTGRTIIAIIVGLITASEIIRAQDLAREREGQKRIEEQRRLDLIEKQRQAEEARRRQLDSMATHWNNSQSLVAFIRDCERQLAATSAKAPERLGYVGHMPTQKRLIHLRNGSLECVANTKT